jgi:hypothetical protein
MKTAIRAFTLGLLLSTAAFAGEARADGLAAKTSALSPAARSSLQAEIESAKTSFSTVRAKVRDVQSVKPEVYKQRRNPVPEAGRELQGLGKDALIPMLEALAFDASQPGLTQVEAEALTVGMLSAVGKLRDSRSAPVLRAVFEAQTSSTPIAFAAADALGKLCGTTERALLTDQLKDGNSLRLAAVAGLGECRHKAVVSTLAPLTTSGESPLRIEAVKALGSLGSSWAWATLGKERAAEALAIRNAAAAAVVDAFVRNEDVRTAAKRALTQIESPQALDLVRTAKANATDAGTIKALAGLEKNLEKLAKRSKR